MASLNNHQFSRLPEPSNGKLNSTSLDLHQEQARPDTSYIKGLKDSKLSALSRKNPKPKGRAHFGFPEPLASPIVGIENIGAGLSRSGTSGTRTRTPANGTAGPPPPPPASAPAPENNPGTEVATILRVRGGEPYAPPRQPSGAPQLPPAERVRRSQQTQWVTGSGGRLATPGTASFPGEPDPLIREMAYYESQPAGARAQRLSAMPAAASRPPDNDEAKSVLADLTVRGLDTPEQQALRRTELHAEVGVYQRIMRAGQAPRLPSSQPIDYRDVMGGAQFRQPELPGGSVSAGE